MPLILNSAGAIIRNHEGHLLLEYRNDTNDWGIPGGYMEPGETFEETIRRELIEELSITVTSLNFLNIYSGKDYFHEYPNGDKVYSIMAMFEATIHHDIKTDHKEIGRVNYFSFDYLPKDLTLTTQKILSGIFR
ncbi:NUDIX hydrolase [Bacillus mesophilus]|nr:NUDIX domain-containing protein [Bacillus mesophilus]